MFSKPPKQRTVFQSCAGITIDPKGSIGTFGCGPCVGVCGWHPIGISFCIHFANSREPMTCGSFVYQLKHCLEHLTGSNFSDVPFDIHLFGGYSGTSDELVRVIKDWLDFVDILFNIVSDTTCSSHGGLSSASMTIDTRGNIFPFDISQSSNCDDCDVMCAMLSCFNPNVRITHLPEIIGGKPFVSKIIKSDTVLKVRCFKNCKKHKKITRGDLVRNNKIGVRYKGLSKRNKKIHQPR